MRDQLIQAAIDRFGTRGFEAVGTREIAAAVGTRMSSITYHFGGKEGLYIAAAEHIFETLQGLMDPLDAQFPGADATTQARVDWICALLQVLGKFMLAEESKPFALFVNREQQVPTPKVREMMNHKVMPMQRKLVDQVMLVRPDLSLDEARALSVYLFGMTISLRHGYGSITLLYECEHLDAKAQAVLLAQLEKGHRALLQAGPAQ